MQYIANKCLQSDRAPAARSSLWGLRLKQAFGTEKSHEEHVHTC